MKCLWCKSERNFEQECNNPTVEVKLDFTSICEDCLQQNWETAILGQNKGILNQFMDFIRRVQKIHDEYQQVLSKEGIIREKSLIPLPKSIGVYLVDDFLEILTEEKREYWRIVMNFTAEVLHGHELAMEYFWKVFVHKRQMGQPIQKEMEMAKQQWEILKKKGISPKYDRQLHYAFAPLSHTIPDEHISTALYANILTGDVDRVEKILKRPWKPNKYKISRELKLAIIVQDCKLITLINDKEKANANHIVKACQNLTFQYLTKFIYKKMTTMASEVIKEIDKVDGNDDLLPAESTAWLISNLNTPLEQKSSYLNLGKAPQSYIQQLMSHTHNLKILRCISKKIHRDKNDFLLFPRDVKKELDMKMPTVLVGIVVCYLWNAPIV